MTPAQYMEQTIDDGCTCAHPSVCPNHASAWAGCTCGTDHRAETGKTPTRTCTGPLKYSCAELGVCQGRNPPCSAACHATATVGLPVTMLGVEPAEPTEPIDTSILPPGGFWFAPGTIDRTPPRRERWSWLEISLAAVCVSGVVGFVAGIGTMWWKGLL